MLRQKGVITVYLAMIFLIVISLIFTVAESARLQASRMLLETAVDAGIESFAAGYHRELYEEYDIFMFDGAFGGSGVSETGLAGKLQEHMKYMLKPDKGTFLLNTDFCQMKIQNITVDKLALATDDQGKVFREQVINYMESAVGITTIEQLTEKYNWAMDNIGDSNSFVEKEKETNQSIGDMEEEKAAIDTEKAEDARNATKQSNPTAEVDVIRSTGILELMYEDTSKISQKSIQTDSLPSNRELRKGTGLDSYEEGVVSNILFQSYLMNKFIHAALEEDNQEGNLQYQIEYLLMGNGHDVDNLKGVINRILLIREGSNFTYLLTDAAKVSEAYAAATLLVGYTGIVPLIEATKYAILLAWAYAESVLDVKVLLAGEKVTLVKTAENWKTSLANIGELASMDAKQMGDSTGMTYKDYLQMMLLVANQGELAMRALDLIEIQMKQVTQNTGFQIDNCVAMIEVTVNVESSPVFFQFVHGIGAGSRKLTATRQYAYGR